jgi:hypothetical protein
LSFTWQQAICKKKTRMLINKRISLVFFQFPWSKRKDDKKRTCLRFFINLVPIFVKRLEQENYVFAVCLTKWQTMPCLFRIYNLRYNFQPCYTYFTLNITGSMIVNVSPFCSFHQPQFRINGILHSKSFIQFPLKMRKLNFSIIENRPK